MRIHVRAVLALTLVVSILASASPASSAAGFGDVDEGRYYTAPVQWMVDNEITTGTSPTCFSPGQPVTRGQAAAFLWRFLDRPSAAPHPFDDVAEAWQHGPISWLFESGITTGTSETTFSPSQPLTRGQFAALLHRLEGRPAPTEAHPFVDVTAGWQQDAVSWLFSTGITEGTSATEFSPNAAVTRGQIATFLYRYAGSPAVVVDRLSTICGTGSNGAEPALGEGFDSLFIGHSFFRPMAEQMATLAPAAGFDEHDQDVFFSGGASGAPLGIWNQPAKRTQIQEVLDTGTVELFGMTYHPTYPTLEGYRNWIDYALANNDDTIFFVAIPWLTDPVTYTAADYAASVDAAYPVIAPPLIDQLRREYPNNTFFAIPYGIAAAELYTRWDAGELPDITQLVGRNGTGVFRDDFGHADEILEDLASLVWLRAMYDVDLTTFDAGYEWSIDLNAIATSILDDHDPAYDAPWRS
ncbi:MAG: S-layer homology domain-containing protein [Actinomycetota bacterium]